MGSRCWLSCFEESISEATALNTVGYFPGSSVWTLAIVPAEIVTAGTTDTFLKMPTSLTSGGPTR